MRSKILKGRLDRRMVALSLLAAVISGCLGGCVSEKPSGSTDITATEPDICAVLPENGAVVSLANDEVGDFVENYEWGMGTYSLQPYYGKGDHYAMKGVELSWEAKEPSLRYEVYLSPNADMSDAVIYRTEENSLLIADLYVNTTYYWQVAGSGGTSPVFSFRTADTPRTIEIQGVSNSRDLGGKQTESGKRIRQGVVYRGAKLDDITAAGKKAFLNTYGIRTDLDLRAAAEGYQGSSPVDEEVAYFNYSCPYYTSGNTSATTGIDEKENFENMASIMRLFANEENYPIYFHCAIGRDRTSMVAMLLLGVCGVSKTDIYMDYELSFFSESGCTDKASVETMMKNFTLTVNYIMSVGDSHGTFQENCEAYLLKIGLTRAEIEAIRTNLLEA